MAKGYNGTITDITGRCEYRWDAQLLAREVKGHCQLSRHHHQPPFQRRRGGRLRLQLRLVWQIVSPVWQVSIHPRMNQLAKKHVEAAQCSRITRQLKNRVG